VRPWCSLPGNETLPRDYYTSLSQLTSFSRCAAETWNEATCIPEEASQISGIKKFGGEKVVGRWEKPFFLFFFWAQRALAPGNRQPYRPKPEKDSRFIPVRIECEQLQRPVLSPAPGPEEIRSRRRCRRAAAKYLIKTEAPGVALLAFNAELDDIRILFRLGAIGCRLRRAMQERFYNSHLPKFL